MLLCIYYIPEVMFESPRSKTLRGQVVFERIEKTMLSNSRLCASEPVGG